MKKFNVQTTKMNVILKLKILKEKMIRCSNFKKRIKEYFSMERSIGHLMEIAQDFNVISIGINEINDGIKNPKRFQLSIFHLINLAIFSLFLILFSISNHLYSLLKVDFLSDHFRLLFLAFSISFTGVAIIKIDMIFGEIKINFTF